jgi:hypothetical protein
MFLLGCPVRDSYPRGQVCDDIETSAASVASRCVGEGASEKVGRAWRQEVSCTPGQTDLPLVRLFECADAVEDISCDQYQDKKDDFDAWIAVSSTCEAFLNLSDDTGD